MNVINTILEIFFPASCIVCGAKGTDLCVKCLSNSREAERECAKWIFPLYDYRHPAVKKAIWILKYKGKLGVADIFAQVMYGRILEELGELAIMENFREPILIPVPLSKRRQRERGYNQTELICEKLVALDNQSNQSLTLGNCPKSDFGGNNFVLEKNILIKIKETEHQAYIKDRNARLKNLAGSFAVKNSKENDSSVKGKNIILIDDVTTTGATLNEARKILKQAGARKIIAFTVAH